MQTIQIVLDANALSPLRVSFYLFDLINADAPVATTNIVTSRGYSTAADGGGGDLKSN